MVKMLSRLGALRPHIFDVLLGALAFALSAAMLFGYDLADDGVLRVLMLPHAKITEAYYHITMPYQNGVGYVAISGDFIISPACMGVRFIVMLFCMVVCVFTRRFRGKDKLVFFSLSLVGSVIIGILASCVRIISSVPLVLSGQFVALHAGTGVVIYLLTLVGIYVLINRCLNNRATGGSYEKQ